MIKETKDINYLNSLSDYQITINPFTHILVYEENLIKGFVDYNLLYDRIEINFIFVKEKYRHQKIAYQLLKYIIEQNDFYNITLEVNIDNEYAIRLYKSLNFEIIGKRSNYYNGKDAYLMEVKK